MNNNLNIGGAIQTGYELMCDEQIRVSMDKLESLVEFKGILRAILNGQLIIASPDRLLPEGVNTPEKESESVEKDGE